MEFFGSCAKNNNTHLYEVGIVEENVYTAQKKYPFGSSAGEICTQLLAMVRTYTFSHCYLLEHKNVIQALSHA